MNLELSPLFVQIPLFILNIYFEFQVYMFSNGRDMTKCHSFCITTTTTTTDNYDAKTIAIPWVFSENCRAKNLAMFKLKAFVGNKLKLFQNTN